MEDRVKVLLERVKGTATTVGEMAGTTARYASKYAGQMVDVAKLNMHIFDLRNECNELLQAVGQVVYDAHVGAETDDSAISHLLELVDEKNTAIEELKGRISLLKSCKACPACGVDCSQEDRFCKACGGALK